MYLITLILLKTRNEEVSNIIFKVHAHCKLSKIIFLIELLQTRKFNALIISNHNFQTIFQF